MRRYAWPPAYSIRVLNNDYIRRWAGRETELEANIAVEGPKYDKAFEQVDFVVGPTTPSPPFKIGEKADDPLSMYLEDLYTVTTNLAGDIESMSSRLLGAFSSCVVMKPETHSFHGNKAMSRIGGRSGARCSGLAHGISRIE